VRGTLRFSQGAMEVRECQVPGALWIVPVDHQIATEESNKQLYIHIIPLNITYKILLDIDIPVVHLFDAMANVLGQFKSEKDKGEAKYNLYWKKTNVNTKGSDVSSTLFPRGATLLMTDGDPILPTFHSGKLWQCETCPYSFHSFTNLNEHVWKNKRHQINNFGTPINWGALILPEEEKEIPTNNRRQMMEEAIKKPENVLIKFAPDAEDYKWEMVARKHIVEKSRKYKSNQDNMNPEFVKAIKEGKDDVPDDCYRQMPGTWDAYKPQFHKIMTFYQGVKKRPLHYRDFLAFGSENLVHLSEPEEFFNNWKGATPEMLKKCLAAHNVLLDLVRKLALSAEGLEDFGKPYKDSQDASRKGIIDQGNFLQNLDRIVQQIKAKQLWSTYAIRATAKRKHIDQLKDKLEESTIKKGNTNLKAAVDKFLGSDFAIEAEKDLMYAATENMRLSNKKWNNLSEFVITRLIIFSGGRTESGDLTVEEWDSRLEDEDGTTTIDRSFTKLEGTLETFLHLDDVETFLFKAYEIARYNQFPELDKEERRSLQSFFLNSAGKSYWHGPKGNPNHLKAWNEITDRFDVITDFRRIMATWSLSVDQVTRANSAFVCAHSVEIMTKVYARQKTKQKEGIKVLERYRIEELGRRATSSEGRRKFLDLQLSPELEERQRKLRTDSYNMAFHNAIKVEREHHIAQHREKPDSPASNASRASLIEIIADELESGEPVSPEDGFLSDMFLRRIDGMKKRYVSSSKATEAILSAIDSPRFAKNTSAICLKEILVMAASSKIANRVDIIEETVVRKWMNQLENWTKAASKLQCFRTKAAFISLANSAGNEKTYSLGNTRITSQVRNMKAVQERYTNDYQTNQKKNQRKYQELNQKKALKKAQQVESPSTPKRISPRLTPKTETPKRQRPQSVGKKAARELFSTPPPKKGKINEKKTEPESTKTPPTVKAEDISNEENITEKKITPQTPSPIKLDSNSGGKRKANWTRDQRKTLLGHIIKNMDNPTVGRMGGLGKMDLEKNVLPKVSPNLDEKPDKCRSLGDIVAQWYRYVYELDYVSA